MEVKVKQWSSYDPLGNPKSGVNHLGKLKKIGAKEKGVAVPTQHDHYLVFWSYINIWVSKLSDF